MTNNKIAIVYSETSANKFFDKKAYGELFANAQSQAIQSGNTFDLLTEADLRDTAKLQTYGAIVFPYMANVRAADLPAIEQALSAASAKGVKLIASGDFLTNDENGSALGGDPYARMATLLDVRRVTGGSTLGTTTLSTASGLPLLSYTDNNSFNTYVGGANSQVLATQSNSTGTSAAVIQTTKGVHFSDPRFFADSGLSQGFLSAGNLLDLKMTRGTSLFVSRQDVDISRSAEFAPKVEAAVGKILEEWKTSYGFVGSSFVNGTVTPELKAIYQKWLGLGNEISTHSKTHPENVNLLNATQLSTEFKDHAAELRAALGVKANGIATPGNPENLFVDQTISSFVPQGYVSGVGGSSYTNSFGFIAPTTEGAVFLKPNISFDFNLVEFKKLTATQAEVQWTAEYEQLKATTSTPIIEFPWHDYALTADQGANGTTIDGSVNPGYNRAMFENFIARAAKDGTEFVTADSLQQRFRAAEAITFDVRAQSPNALEVTLKGSNLGQFSMDLGKAVTPGLKIASVQGSFAYDSNSVFSTSSGGTYVVNLGTSATDISHITKLGQRQELLATGGNQETGALSFSFNGEGLVELEGKDLELWQKYVVKGANTQVISGDKITLGFTANGFHEAGLEVQDIAPLTKGNDRGNKINGTSKADYIQGLKGNDIIYGNAGADVLIGNGGWDSLYGGSGSDVLIGTDSQARGLNEIDSLTGGTGSDLFVLGDKQGAYYALDGLKGYAKVTDFKAEDRLQLHGQASDYSLKGTELYYGNDLIATGLSTNALAQSTFVM
jgi:RTX calcium-binding nonapeptide repeat (4 copies)